jgi:RNA polymerase sigma factor (sigma-70 family)
MSQRPTAPLGAAPFAHARGNPYPGEEAGATDAELCQVIGAGFDREGRAVAELYRRHAPLALAHARALSRGASASEDLVNDAFVRTWQRLAAGVEIESFAAYLLRAVRNGHIDSIRQLDRLVSLDVVMDAGGAAQTVTDGSGALEEADLVRRVLATLSPRQRHAMWLRVVEGYSTAEIAAVLGTSSNAAAALLHRARRAVATAARAELVDEPVAC